MLAATLSTSGTIGVVGPIEVGDAKLYVDGFKAGVAATNPDAVVNVNYIGSFSDVALASEAATTHISAGADALTGTAQMVVGAIGKAEEANALWFGTQSNQSSLAPTIVVASQVYHWEGVFPMFLGAPVIETIRGELYTEYFVSGQLSQRIVITGSLPSESSAVSNRQIIIRYRLKDSLEPWVEVAFTAEPITFNVPCEGIFEVSAKQKGVLQGLPGYFGLVESLWTTIEEVNVTSVFELGLPAPSEITGFYEMDAQGRVSRVKLRMHVDITTTIPSAVALMVSVQEVPRILDARSAGEKHGTRRLGREGAGIETGSGSKGNFKAGAAGSAACARSG